MHLSSGSWGRGRLARDDLSALLAFSTEFTMHTLSIAVDSSCILLVLPVPPPHTCCCSLLPWVEVLVVGASFIAWGTLLKLNLIGF